MPWESKRIKCLCFITFQQTFSSLLVPSCGVWNPQKLIRQHTYSRLEHSYTLCRSAVSPSTVSRVRRRYRDINQYNRRDSEALRGQQPSVRIAVCPLCKEEQENCQSHTKWPPTSHLCAHFCPDCRSETLLRTWCPQKAPMQCCT